MPSACGQEHKWPLRRVSHTCHADTCQPAGSSARRCISPAMLCSVVAVVLGRADCCATSSCPQLPGSQHNTQAWILEVRPVRLVDNTGSHGAANRVLAERVAVRERASPSHAGCPSTRTTARTRLKSVATGRKPGVRSGCQVRCKSSSPHRAHADMPLPPQHLVLIGSGGE